ncbi:hypothetical protein NA56DRAFT_545391, partial [Hyaloscypha hepaticicola]
APNTISPYLQAALQHPSLSGTVSIYNPSFSPSPSPQTSPSLAHNKPNTLLLYPGSFNPPHVGHLATIQYLYLHRQTLNLTTLFLFSDPSSTILSKRKAHNSIILPLSLRNEIFYNTPELTPLIQAGFLQILVGTMDSHIQFLRYLTDLMVKDGWDVKLVGFLGGDKLSRDSKPDEKPGELGIWGPVDEFLILNARRPVDFYTPSTPSTPSNPLAPENLPGCTKWERGRGTGDNFWGVEAERGAEREAEREVGVEWVCRALSVEGEPIIRFQANGESMSDGVSSTAIRKIMCEAPNEILHEELAPHVLGVDMVVEWL